MSIRNLLATSPIRRLSQVHDEGVQVLENIANIRVPVIAAIEGRAHVHSDYALLASVIVAAEGATSHDVAHFAAGVAAVQIFTTWSIALGQDERSVLLDQRLAGVPHMNGESLPNCIKR